ncbi:hypothetical protein [Hamadaea tsunoensis]|uniref:hypothetical protein n=1 Tax=Hamadaea tsunoensis TaxID=53368 RepID=UPI000552E1D2|nr:hypothetical protein [Hamadaea tsunoensis]
MDLSELERRMATLDAAYRPVSTGPVDLGALDTLGERVTAELAALGVDEQAQVVLRAVLDLYASGDERTRSSLRGLFDRYTAFRWAAHLPSTWDSPEEFRAHLIHLSVRDQGADTRDEILELQGLCEQARRAGIDPRPALAEVAAMSSDENRYGMGSMRSIFLTYGGIAETR